MPIMSFLLEVYKGIDSIPIISSFKPNPREHCKRFLIVFVLWWICYYIMAVFGGAVADYRFPREPTMDPEPYTLPDFGFQIFPEYCPKIYGSNIQSDVLILFFYYAVGRSIFHKQGRLIMQRLLLLNCLMFLTRTTVVGITSLPQPNFSNRCKEEQVHPFGWIESVRRVTSSFPPRACGDLIYSGHIACTLLFMGLFHKMNLMPNAFVTVLLWACSCVALVSIFCCRSHYSVDVILGIYFSYFLSTWYFLRAEGVVKDRFSSMIAWLEGQDIDNRLQLDKEDSGDNDEEMSFAGGTVRPPPKYYGGINSSNDSDSYSCVHRHVYNSSSSSRSTGSEDAAADKRMPVSINSVFGQQGQKANYQPLSQSPSSGSNNGIHLNRSSKKELELERERGNVIEISQYGALSIDEGLLFSKKTIKDPSSTDWSTSVLVQQQLSAQPDDIQSPIKISSSGVFRPQNLKSSDGRVHAKVPRFSSTKSTKNASAAAAAAGRSVSAQSSIAACNGATIDADVGDATGATRAQANKGTTSNKGAPPSLSSPPSHKGDRSNVSPNGRQTLSQLTAATVALPSSTSTSTTTTPASSIAPVYSDRSSTRVDQPPLNTNTPPVKVKRAELKFSPSDFDPVTGLPKLATATSSVKERYATLKAQLKNNSTGSTKQHQSSHSPYTAIRSPNSSVN